MASTARTHLRRRLGVLVAVVAVFTALMTVTAAASMPAVGAPAPGLTRPGTTTPITRTSNPSSTRPRTPAPGFLLDRGRVTKFDAPQASGETAPSGINNHGQIAGSTLTDLATLAGARGFLLAKGVKGPFTPIDVPGAPRTLVFGLNDRGQLVGVYENTAATPSPHATGMQPLRLMRQGDLAAVVSDTPEDLRPNRLVWERHDAVPRPCVGDQCLAGPAGRLTRGGAQASPRHRQGGAQT